MAEQHRATQTPDLRAAWGMSEEGAQLAERAYRDWMQGAETLQSHALEFWSDGFRRGLDVVNEMARCETAAEAFGVQARYASETMQGLLAESQKVIDQLAAFTQTPWATVALTPLGGRPGAAGNNGQATHGADGHSRDNPSPREASATAPRSSHRRS